MTEREPLAPTNERVKQARRLRRRPERTERRLFLAEGPQAVESALTRPGCVVEVFASAAGAEQFAALLARSPVTLLSDRALASLSDAVTPAGLVAVCRALDRPLEVALAGAPRLVAVCADVRDPGNAGTIVRSADAAGADAVVLTGDCVDPHNAKAVRASAGSVFHLPLALERDPEAVVRACRAAGLQVLAADAVGDVDLAEAAGTRAALLARPTAWLFGNEAWGLPAELLALADHRVRIPIYGRAESLNLAAAAAVCLYAGATAQHRPANP